MSTITKEFTKEQLQQIIETDHVQCGEASSLARIALASLEAEAVGEVVLGEYDDCGCHPDARVACIAADGQADWENFKDGTRLYTAPPAPISVPAAMEMDDDFDSAFEHGKAVGWNAYRAAMLQSFGNSEQLNSPVIQDGWVMVPIEPTGKMIIEGFESEPDEFFSDADVWKAYEAMSGCQQAAHRAELCWAAMIAAAPKTGDSNG
ncbi:phage protein [Enterobacter kobei]|uniref:hypothetical protein n=1 Tax=Enterobacter kobei TaxID=208224 RepID=UPI001916B85F|nr:hypothetical protein [Enterobacter kobei]GHS73630.1 phage protein [Enterobacter kobei]